MPSQKVKINAKDQNGNMVVLKRDKEYAKPINQTIYNVLLNSLKWDQEIGVEEADSILEKSFYPFKEVLFLSFLLFHILSFLIFFFSLLKVKYFSFLEA